MTVIIRRYFENMSEISSSFPPHFRLKISNARLSILFGSATGRVDPSP